MLIASKWENFRIHKTPLHNLSYWIVFVIFFFGYAVRFAFGVLLGDLLCLLFVEKPNICEFIFFKFSHRKCDQEKWKSKVRKINQSGWLAESNIYYIPLCLRTKLLYFCEKFFLCFCNIKIMWKRFPDTIFLKAMNWDIYQYFYLQLTLDIVKFLRNFILNYKNLL